MSKRAVGLTGGRGVLGSRVAKHLRSTGTSVSLFPGDVRDNTDLDQWIYKDSVDTVVHLAAVVPTAKVTGDPFTAIAVNVGGTANVAQASARAGARLVYVSTSHAYAPSDAPLTESDACEPSSLYGLSKFQGEEWCRALVENLLVVRVFSFFDNAQPSSFVIPSLRDRIADAPTNGTVEVQGFDSVRDFSSARWLAKNLSVLALGSHRGTVNLGSGSGVTIGTVATLLTQITGRTDVNVMPVFGTADSLVADVHHLRGLISAVDWAPFDLSAELKALVHER